MSFYNRALELKEEMISNRRYLHQNAEVGLELPKTVAYVMEKLTEYGLEPKKCGHGIIADLGQGGKTLLIRADMDALPMKEQSGEPFASLDEHAAHCCGHDLHASMLLTVAKMLKEQEASLKGTIRFMFQPAEETFEGARDMIENGLFEPKRPDAALGLHVMPGMVPVGTLLYNNTGAMMSSVNGFRIHIQGKGGHGGFPHNAISPITIGAHIHLALLEMIAAEAEPTHSCVLSMGRFEAGKVANIIPDTAIMEGALRTKNEATRARLVQRIQDICELTAKRYGGSVTIETLSEMASLTCDSAMTTRMVEYARELEIPGLKEQPGRTANASEDFAMISTQIPSVYFQVSAGFADERGKFAAHNPKVRYDEDVCPIGASVVAHCAMRWLEDNQ